MKKIRIGSGAGYGGDRLEPALDLLERGNLDYMAFECLAERTIALAQKERRQNPEKGYNHLLEYRMERVLPLAWKNKVKIITNMGAANPEGALRVLREMASRLGLHGLKLAAVTGDDIFDQISKYHELPLLETGSSLSSIEEDVLSANAYLGVAPIVEALVEGADIIITGRVADPSLFLAPMVYEFGWDLNSHDLLGKGTLVGHLLECAGQVCGGYFADPGKKDVPDLWNLGFPYAEVDETGNGFISKLPGTGGIINRATCTEQLIYEIHDPAAYLTPDCIANFSNVEFTEVGKDKLVFSGATGKEPTNTFKVSLGYFNGYTGEGQISYAGPNNLERAKLALDIVRKRLEIQNVKTDELRFDLIGLDSVSLANSTGSEIPELRLRVAGKTRDRENAERIANEVESLYTNGPAGGGGASKHVGELISVLSVLIPKEDFNIKINYHTI